MSHAVAIGLEGQTECTRTVAALESAGFTPTRDVAPQRSHVLAELIAAAQGAIPGLEWFVAMRSGEADLDIIYRFSEWGRAGVLHDMAEIFLQERGLERVVVFIYDLAEPETIHTSRSPLADMALTLATRYDCGGPVGSAHHEFVRAVSG